MAYRSAEANGWECADLPIVCESCLGPKLRLNMTRDLYGKECKICQRPFTVFRWRPDRHKKMEICGTCSRVKNVCQVCILDLQYGLPVQVRDTSLSIDTNEAIPRTGVNREFFAEEQDRRARAGLLEDDYGSYHYGRVEPNNTSLLKLQRTTPYYKRNRPHLCSFYRRGRCKRGAECPYIHEMPKTGELSKQNIKDRYYGVNDPVARKLFNKAGEMGKPGPVAESWMPPTVPVSQEEEQHGQMGSICYGYPIHTSYPSTDPQRMGAVLPSQECSALSRFARPVT